MEIMEPGHVYRMGWLDCGDDEWPSPLAPDLVFVNREDNPHPGTQTQEVLRALIDRTMHCDNCLRWEGNDLIIYHLRMALVLHEARALIRKTQKGLINPETIRVGEDGHFLLQGQSTGTDHDAYTSKAKLDTPIVEDMASATS